ncbi:MAG: DUF3566 domain-containing protein [Acidimicrobiales bacterium]
MWTPSDRAAETASFPADLIETNEVVEDWPPIADTGEQTDPSGNGVNGASESSLAFDHAFDTRSGSTRSRPPMDEAAIADRFADPVPGADATDPGADFADEGVDPAVTAPVAADVVAEVLGAPDPSAGFESADGYGDDHAELAHAAYPADGAPVDAEHDGYRDLDAGDVYADEPLDSHAATVGFEPVDQHDAVGFEPETDGDDLAGPFAGVAEAPLIDEAMQTTNDLGTDVAVVDPRIDPGVVAPVAAAPAPAPVAPPAPTSPAEAPSVVPEPTRSAGSGAAVRAGSSAAAARAGDLASRMPQLLEDGLRNRSQRVRARKVRRVIRHVDPWSVLTFSVLFQLCVFAAMLRASVLVWSVADAAGTIGNIENFVRELGDYTVFEIHEDVVFRAALVAAGILTLASSLIAVLLAVVFNLISDLVGGIRITVVEEETVRVNRKS